ncbi:hypothetical protein SUGI_0621680 [Cryptomeria japonica]|nr:hypothetical protein SUGI_0621680 [Cryptomeria japonica]
MITSIFSHVIVHPQRYEYGDVGKLSPQTKDTKLGLAVEAERNDGGSDVLQECVGSFLEMQNPHEVHGFLETPVWVKKGLESETRGQIVVHGMERTGQSHREQEHSNLQKSWKAFGLGGSLQEAVEEGSVNIEVHEIYGSREGLAYFHKQLESLVDKYPEVSHRPKTVEVQDVFSLFISEEVEKVVLPYINFVLPIDLGHVLNHKKVVAAVLLVVLGVNSSSSVDEIKNILRIVGIDCDDERIELLLGNLKRRDSMPWLAFLIIFYRLWVETYVYALSSVNTLAGGMFMRLEALNEQRGYLAQSFKNNVLHIVGNLSVPEIETTLWSMEWGIAKKRSTGVGDCGGVFFEPL